MSHSKTKCIPKHSAYSSLFCKFCLPICLATQNMIFIVIKLTFWTLSLKRHLCRDSMGSRFTFWNPCRWCSIFLYSSFHDIWWWLLTLKLITELMIWQAYPYFMNLWLRSDLYDITLILQRYLFPVQTWSLSFNTHLKPSCEPIISITVK